MKRRYLKIMWLILLVVFSNPDMVAQKYDYLRIVEEYANTLLKHAKDTYGPIHTPVFIDAVNVENYEPYIWEIDPQEPVVAEFGQPDKQIMANFLFMQNILITLKELSKLTGDDKYIQEARRCAQYALNHFTDEDGLIYWGKHATYDALSDQNLGHNGRPNFIYFNTGGFADWPFLYSIDPEKVDHHIEQQWNVTLSKKEWWRRLEWNLHPTYGKPSYKLPWDNAELIGKNVKVPFITDEGKMYMQIGAELIYSAFEYSIREGNDGRAIQAGEAILKRYHDARDPVTGLCTSSYGIPANEPDWGDRSVRRKSRDLIGIPFWATFADIVSETPLAELALETAIEDIHALIKYKLIQGTNMYYPTVMLDGTPASNPVQFDEGILWALAKTYRLSGDTEIWAALRSLIKSFGFGDIGGSPDDKKNLSINLNASITVDTVTNNNVTEGFFIHTFVELYHIAREEIGDKKARPFLDMASKLADTIIDQTYVNGLFVRHKNAKWARTASMTPLALLNVEAAQKGIELEKSSVFVRHFVYRFTRKNNRVPGDNGHDWQIYKVSRDE